MNDYYMNYDQTADEMDYVDAEQLLEALEVTE